MKQKYSKESNKIPLVKAKQLFCVRKAVSFNKKIAMISSCKKSSMYLHSITSFNNTILCCPITRGNLNLLSSIWIVNLLVVSFNLKFRISMVSLKAKYKVVSCMKKWILTFRMFSTRSRSPKVNRLLFNKKTSTLSFWTFICRERPKKTKVLKCEYLTRLCIFFQKSDKISKIRR